jgi:hypothetical protein
LGEHQLAAAYRLDEPWNSPNNLRLGNLRPWHFQIYDAAITPEPSATSLHLLKAGSQPIVIQHERAICNWLEPTEFSLSQWNALNQLAEKEKGFWKRGFFMSEYRGRLAISKPKVIQIHPGQDLSQLLNTERRQSAAANWKRIQIGAPVRRYHFDHAFQLASFFLIALYPIRWLKRIQSAESSPA